MTGRDLGAKVSSLFDVVALHRPLKNAGSSVISYACDPRHDEDVGLHRAKKVFFSCLWFWTVRDRVTKYLIFHMENMHNFEKKSIAFHWQILVIKIYQKKKIITHTYLTDIWGLFKGLLREHVSVGSTIKVQSGQSQAHYRAGPAS